MTIVELYDRLWDSVVIAEKQNEDGYYYILTLSISVDAKEYHLTSKEVKATSNDRCFTTFRERLRLVEHAFAEICHQLNKKITLNDITIGRGEQ